MLLLLGGGRGVSRGLGAGGGRPDPQLGRGRQGRNYVQLAGVTGTGSNLHLLKIIH